ncbi:MAG TPA: hypothetical protein VGM62_11790, partial [Chthoniobacterales bacterium]
SEALAAVPAAVFWPLRWISRGEATPFLQNWFLGSGEPMKFARQRRAHERVEPVADLSGAGDLSRT